jgi:hypothetical protein
MPAKDIIHDAVKHALMKDGWTITADPFSITFGDLNLVADLAAERPLSAEKNGRKIAVEIKSFLSPSPIRELETAIGQYQLNQAFLEATEPDRRVFLGISEAAYHDTFQREAVQFIVERFQIALLVVDLEGEEIVKWTS